ncbi:MAG TPA: tripartite tricarboxylate transporter TctB family protein [Candidatus Limnocylindria bacterium]|nr:tripartite tricarboxylate transporter TctB family protein [Candidatus Limnocylindria bacterium]
MGELIFNVLLLVFFAVMAVVSNQITIKNDVLTARYWPMVVLVLIILLLAYKIYKIWAALPKEERKLSLGIFKLGDKGVQRFLVSILLLLAYVIALPYLGFVLTTMLFFAAMAFLIGARKLPVIVLASVGITAAVWAVFVWGLDVFPPRGVGFLEDVSIWLEYLI